MANTNPQRFKPPQLLLNIPPTAENNQNNPQQPIKNSPSTTDSYDDEILNGLDFNHLEQNTLQTNPDANQ